MSRRKRSKSTKSVITEAKEVTKTVAEDKPSRRYGFFQEKDERDVDFPLSLSTGVVRNIYRISKYWPTGEILDQGDSSACVGHAWSQFVSSAPKMDLTPDPFKIYHLAQELDEFDGGEPNRKGTSLRGGAKACRQLGLIESDFRWAFDAITIWKFLRTRGPVIVGTQWYSKMDVPDRHGVATPEGDKLGGHAYMLCGVNSDTKMFLAVNSWGHKFNPIMKGKFWLPMESLSKLLHEGGYACSAIES